MPPPRSEDDRAPRRRRLDGASRDAPARDYRALRLARIDAILAAIRADPPDYDAAIAAARGLFAHEDALVAPYGGEPARIAWRRSSVDARTVILAVGASMADHDPDEALGW